MTRETLTKEHIENLKRSIQEKRGGLKGHYNPRHNKSHDEKYQKVKELMAQGMLKYHALAQVELDPKAFKRREKWEKENTASPQE